MRERIKGATYHVYSLGNQKQYIFDDEQAIGFFIKSLAERASRLGVQVHAYCVMGTHYHLLITTPEGNISEFMHSVLTSYASYKTHNGWVGHVFSRRFESKLVTEDDYLLTLTGYIHLNPVKARMVTLPEQYSWSSCRAYLDEDNAVSPDYCPWLTTTLLLDQFSDDPVIARKLLRSFLWRKLEELNKLRSRPVSLEETMLARGILGGSDHAGEMKELIEWDFQLERDDDEARKRKVLCLRRILQHVLESFEVNELWIDEMDLDHDAARKQKARRVFIFLARELTTARNNEIAKMIGNAGDTAVSNQYNKMIRQGGIEGLRADEAMVVNDLLQTWRSMPGLNLHLPHLNKMVEV